MPNTRLPMNHAREILRLSRERKMSGRAIAKSLSLSTSTISKYLRQLESVPWPLPEPGGMDLLAQALEKKTAPAPSARIEPDWDQVHREYMVRAGCQEGFSSFKSLWFKNSSGFESQFPTELTWISLLGWDSGSPVTGFCFLCVLFPKNAL